MLTGHMLSFSGLAHLSGSLSAPYGVAPYITVLWPALALRWLGSGQDLALDLATLTTKGDTMQSLVTFLVTKALHATIERSRAASIP